MKQLDTILFCHGYKAILILFSPNIEHILQFFDFWALLSFFLFMFVNLYPITSCFFRIVKPADDVVVYYYFFLFYFSMVLVHINQLVSAVHSLNPFLIELVVLCILVFLAMAQVYSILKVIVNFKKIIIFLHSQQRQNKTD